MSTDTTTETTDADALADELLAIHDATEDGNKVRAEVIGIQVAAEAVQTVPDSDEPMGLGLETYADESAVALTVRLPHGQPETFALDKPVPWEPERFTLAAILEDQGLGPGNVHRLVGEDVLVERDDDEWALVDPMAPPESFDTTTAATGVAVGATVFGASMGFVADDVMGFMIVTAITTMVVLSASGFIMDVMKGDL